MSLSKKFGLFLEAFWETNSGIGIPLVLSIGTLIGGVFLLPYLPLLIIGIVSTGIMTSVMAADVNRNYCNLIEKESRVQENNNKNHASGSTCDLTKKMKMNNPDTKSNKPKKHVNPIHGKKTESINSFSQMISSLSSFLESSTPSSDKTPRTSMEASGLRRR